ncbi:MAG: cell division protein ZapA [Lysobacteraceae bacterium]
MSEPVGIRLLDREYLVGCPPEEKDGLLAAAALIDRQLRDVRAAHRNAGQDRIFVLAALNLAHELIQLRQSEGHSREALRRSLGELNQRLDGLLESVSPRP